MIKIIETKTGTFHIFAGKHKFIKHIKKHIFSETEPWDRVFSRTQLKQFCQKFLSQDVSYVYKAFALKIGDEIKFSSNKPIYAIKIINNKEYTHYFIAKKGFLIIASDFIIKTAYFICDNKNISNKRLFKNAWKAVKRKMHVINYENKDEKIEKIFESYENWEKCPKIN